MLPTVLSFELLSPYPSVAPRPLPAASYVHDRSYTHIYVPLKHSQTPKPLLKKPHASVHTPHPQSGLFHRLGLTRF